MGQLYGLSDQKAVTGVKGRREERSDESHRRFRNNQSPATPARLGEVSNTSHWREFEPYPPRIYCSGSPFIRLSTISLSSTSSHSNSFLLREEEVIEATATLRALSSSRIHFSSSLADSDPIWPLNSFHNALNDELEQGRIRAGRDARVIIIGSDGNGIQILSLNVECQISVQLREGEVREVLGTNQRGVQCLPCS